MVRRANARPALIALASASALLIPAVGRASSGGGGFGPARSGLRSGGAAPSGDGIATAQPGNVTVSATASGMTIATRASALLRTELQFFGSAPQSDAGDPVVIERFGPRTGWSWEPTAQAAVRPDGTFSAVWETDHIGRFVIRALIGRSGGEAAAASVDWPTVTVTVYRPSIATLYGPGFWGQRTACGLVLHRSTIGVANRTLPCGTPVAIYFRGRTMVVPVIDRGPYANGADWDLTMATGRALGVDTTATIGAVSLPRAG